ETAASIERFDCPYRGGLDSRPSRESGRSASRLDWHSSRSLSLVARGPHLIEARKLTTPCEWAEIDRLCRLTGEVDFTSSAPCSGTAQWCGNVFMHDNPAVCPFLEDHRPPPVQMR